MLSRLGFLVALGFQDVLGDADAICVADAVANAVSVADAVRHSQYRSDPFAESVSLLVANNDAQWDRISNAEPNS